MTESQPHPAQWKLVRIEGTDLADTILLTAETTRIGRDLDNDITLNDLQVSRYHALITQEGNQIHIEDLGSVNGISVNGAPVTELLLLQPGDVINIGAATFQIQKDTSNIPQARTPTQIALPLPEVQPKKIWPYLAGIALIVFGLVLVLGLLVLGMWLFSGDTPSATQLPNRVTAAPAKPQIVINQSPSGNSPTFVNQSVTIQATAIDPQGITSIELWANGRKVDEVTNPVAQNVISMAAAFQWTPEVANSYTLEVRSFNESGLSSLAEVATLTVLEGTFTPTATAISTPTPTFTPLPATPTDAPTPTLTPIPASPTPSRPLLFVNVDLLNVHTGPGQQFELVGQLEQGDGVEIIGQATGLEGALWWQIPFRETANGVGWVQADPAYVTVFNTNFVPVVNTPVPVTATPTPSPIAVPVVETETPTPAPSPIPQPTPLRAPEGKTLLIVGNRSLSNQPARLTLSGGKSVGGGKELDPPPGDEIQITLEPDFYRAVWSARNFARGLDFTATPGKIMVMWIVPEEGRTETEIYDELAAPIIQPAADTPGSSGDEGPAVGKALFVVSNRSFANEYALFTISGGSFGGGKEIILNANTETQLELLPGNYRTIWNTPARGGMNAGREFTVSAGETLYGWIVPENGQVFMEFPGQPVIQINN